MKKSITLAEIEAKEAKRREQMREASRRHRERHPERFVARQKQWAIDNAERKKELAAQRYREKKDEILQKNKEWREKNKDKLKRKNRDARLKWKYGISHAEYEELLAKQDGKCGICKRDKPSTMHGWSIDHCHNSSVVRGILCNHCNVGLGSFGDSIEALEAAIEYLKRAQ